MADEIIIYQLNELSTRFEVRLEDETIWLTQAQIVELFESSKANISEHIKNIFQTNELSKNTTVRNFRIVQMEGNRAVSREITHYNLDLIISIGYRVNSVKGTQFRIWANKVLKDYLLKGYVVNHRIEQLESDILSVKTQLQEIDFQIKTSLPPNEGIFFDGQIFDAYVFVTNIIKSAKTSIILIDNYVDESVLVLFSKRAKSVKATIYTKTITKQLELDLKKHNLQYAEIVIKPFADAHDRFLIIDNQTVYHIGASLKDLGKKWFAFSKMNTEAMNILSKLLIKS